MFLADPSNLFVPESPENIHLILSQHMVEIPCRVSHSNAHVILRRVPSGEPISSPYDAKIGFFGIDVPGQYQCESSVNGHTVKSDIYIVTHEGEQIFLLHSSFKNTKETISTHSFFGFCGSFMLHVYVEVITSHKSLFLPVSVSDSDLYQK